MSTAQQILSKLPKEFTRQEWMTELSGTAYSYSYASKLLDIAVFDGDVEKIERGKYKKCEPELETA